MQRVLISLERQHAMVACATTQVAIARWHFRASAVTMGQHLQQFGHGGDFI
jgi:hypothetical protein